MDYLSLECTLIKQLWIRRLFLSVECLSVQKKSFFHKNQIYPYKTPPKRKQETAYTYNRIQYRFREGGNRSPARQGCRDRWLMRNFFLMTRKSVNKLPEYMNKNMVENMSFQKEDLLMACSISSHLSYVPKFIWPWDILDFLSSPCSSL